MTYFLDTLSITDLSTLSLTELLELRTGTITFGSGHVPYIISDLETFNSMYFILDLENWS